MRQIERQAPHRARRVELLRHRDERHILGVENLDQTGKIGERAGQPVDLVHDHDIDSARPDIGEQALRRGSLEIAAREPAIDVVQLVYKAAGGGAVYQKGPLDRCLRDVLTMNQHVVGTLRTYEMAGRLLLGLEPLRWLF